MPFKRKEAKRDETGAGWPERAAAPVIEVSDNGPYVVTGLTDLHNSRGESLLTGTETYLCRCGGSKRKPYCDGSHRDNGFADEKN